MCEKYNGWTNYETWLVNLWIDNDQWEQESWQERAIDECNEAGNKEDAVYPLSQSLKAYFEDECNPLADKANLYADLLNAALSAVNWYEIAQYMIEECDWEPEEEESEEE